MSASILPETIRRQLAEALSDTTALNTVAVHTDTSDFYRVSYGDVLLIDGKGYLIRQNAKEGRFGIDDQEKFWVKMAVDLESGQRKIIKLVFHERFTAHIGGIAFECFRSPRKEARILNLVAGHPNFMQGRSAVDDKGNTVRLIDFIYGRPLSSHVEDLKMDHRTYFYEQFPAILDSFIDGVRAIAFLHANGEKHGDIRRDHILVDREKGLYRWIDFDFNFRHGESLYGYDLFGLGNVLIFLVGKGDALVQDLHRQNHPAMAVLEEGDVNIVFHHRVANLRKVYDYIPESLNRVLLHFSRGANWFYETCDQLLEDLGKCRGELGR
jgi:hypothetical protein